MARIQEGRGATSERAGGGSAKGLGSAGVVEGGGGMAEDGGEMEEGGGGREMDGRTLDRGRGGGLVERTSLPSASGRRECRVSFRSKRRPCCSGWRRRRSRSADGGRAAEGVAGPVGREGSSAGGMVLCGECRRLGAGAASRGGRQGEDETASLDGDSAARRRRCCLARTLRSRGLRSTPASAPISAQRERAKSGPQDAEGTRGAARR